MNQQYTISYLFPTSKTLGSWTFDVAFATNTATVTVNSNPAWRHGDYFYGGDTADNSASALMNAN